MKILLLLLGLLAVSYGAAAADFTEDFEGFLLIGPDPERKPDQAWYDYTEGEDFGNVSAIQDPIIQGSQSFRLIANETTDASDRRADFALEIPTQLNSTTFFIQGQPPANNTDGSQQVISIQSTNPVRTMVSFYLFCTDPAEPTACELRVKFENADVTGQVLINTTVGQTRFKIHVEPNWLNATYQLFVDDVDDGWFPFLEIPDSFARLRFQQYRADIPIDMAFDVWTVAGAQPGSAETLEADAATGIKNFATNIRFTTDASLFMLGSVILFSMTAAVVVPILTLGLDNTVVPATSFFVCLTSLWLVSMEFFPDWVGIAGIIAAAALIGTIVRHWIMGLRNTSSGAGLVAGSLGYFIIASALLAFSGYATETIAIPTGTAEITEGDPNDTQGFVSATLECIFTGGVFTFGLKGDCSQDTTTSFWRNLTDAVSQIFGWVRASFQFLFQLLTFQLPIPVVFNVMIVLPPAATLATYAISIIRGVSS